MNWTQYFGMMADWKKLPAYRAEPRVDSLIGYYLPEFAAEYLGDKIVGIIPELPIRLATVKPIHEQTDYAGRSYKVDFFLLGASGRNYLIEFKTDSGSRTDKQDTYLSEAKDANMAALVEGIHRISKVSSYTEKYNHLLAKLAQLHLMDKTGRFCGSSTEIEIVYIQPSKKPHDKRCIDFSWIADWLERKHGHEHFESELAATLREWSKD